MRTVRIGVVVAALLVGVCGCRKPGAPAPPSTKVKIDGVASEWGDAEPLWVESGLQGRGDFDGLDIKQAYFCSDAEYLYAFFCATPTVQERFNERPQSGGFCDLYFDTDNDSATGCSDVIGFKYGKISGYEIKLSVQLGQGLDLGSRQPFPFVVYTVQTFNGSGQSPPDGAQFTQDSHQEGALIAHGQDGIELAVPLKELGLRGGISVRVLLCEQSHVFEKGGYSEGVLILQ